MTRSLSRVLPVALVLGAMAAAGCAKKDPVSFAPYDEAAIASAKLLEKPILIYATADW